MVSLSYPRRGKAAAMCINNAIILIPTVTVLLPPSVLSRVV